MSGHFSKVFSGLLCSKIAYNAVCSDHNFSSETLSGSGKAFSDSCLKLFSVSC